MKTSHPSVRYHLECINAGDLELMREIMSADFVNLATGFTPMHGVDAMIEGVRSILEGFPGCHSEIETTLDEGDRFAIQWEITGQHSGAFQGIAPTGLDVKIGGIHIDTIVDDRIVKRHAYNNFPLVMAHLRQA
jgi:predicted ester cyclase